MDSEAQDGSVPHDLQVAILDLLESCKEKDISIPDRLGSEFLHVLSSSRKEVAADIITFSERLVEDKEAHKKAISDSPIVIKALEIQRKLKRKRFRASIYVKDGSFKYIEHIDPAEAEKSAESKIETVYYGGRLQGLLRRLLRTLRGDFSGKEAVEHFPVKKINLFFEQGKTYLVLGAPRSGKSSLLKLIAGILPEDKDHAVGGSVNVNKITPKSKGIVWSNVVGYIDQIDRLHPYLTVEETCNFAFKCRTGGTHRSPTDDPGPEAAATVEEMDATQYLVTSVLEAMDLTNVKDTFVGDQQNVRGVSGGEKKRVTVSEMCVGRFPILCMDEISTGLDAATTYGICKLLGEANALMEGIRIVTLLQPPPETFALFDDLIVLSEGQVIYSGPVEKVVPYFESLGYRLPERMDAADWLQSLPTKDGAQFLDVTVEDGNIEGPKRHLSSDEFHSKFYESEYGQKILETLDVPIEVHKRNSELFALQGVRELYTKRFRNSSTQSLKLLIAREFLLWWRDKPVIRARIIQDLLMGVICGTVFWQGWDDVSSVLGILFQSMLYVALGAMMKVAPQYAVRGVLYKHQDANFFPTWTYVVGRSLATIPASVIDGLVYGTIVYWCVGLAHNDGASFGNFIIFVLIIMFSSTGIGLLFSVFSAITKDRSVGQAAMSVSLVLLILFSGFTVTPNNIPGYWIWLYWMNILAWAFRGLIINEYDSGKYDEVTDVEYLGKNFTVGQLIIKNGGFVDGNGEPYTFEWATYAILFSAFICILGVIASSVALVKVRFPTGKSLSNGSLDESNDEEKEVNAVETVLPFQKANLTFKDVHYTIVSSVGNEKIELLKGIDGLIEAGKMTALMGSSGAGKTTLMDVLSLRKSSGEISGEVRLNGHLQEEQSFRRCTGYVEQFDVQTAQLTIRETCEFSAKLRLESTDAAVTPRSRELFIDQTLDMLELTPIQHYLVGSDAGGGLSFEQKKRLSIAVELVANPSILFLDEPTSGLDARAAAIVMRGLKRIALSGRAVCATIHQPSIAIFNSFDSLLLLKRGGEVVFHGELGNESSNLIQYLQSYENTPLIQPGENPATWMLTTIGSGNAKSGNPFDYAGAYTNSQLHTKCLESISRIKDEASNDSLITFPHRYATTTKTQLIEVMKRTWTVYWRSPSYNRTRIIVAALLSLLIGSVFVSNQVPKDDTQMRSRMTTVYLSFLIVAVNGMNTVLSFFEAERNMFYRHKSALMYNTFSVSTAFTLAEIPFLVGTSFLYTTIFYFMVGFATDVEKFGYYYLFMLLCMSLFTYTGQMFIALCRNAQIAQGFCALVGSNTGLFSGVLIQPLNIPKFWIFMYWLLPGHYILEGLLTTQYDNDTTPISAYPGSKFYQYLVDSDQCAHGSKVCIGTAEEWVSSTFDGAFSRENVPYDILYLVGVMVLTRVISVWALAHLNYRVT